MKNLIETLENTFHFAGDAKPCKLFINQAQRTGAVVMGVTAKHPYIVAYLMPSGKTYIKSLTQADADSLMQVDMQKSFNSEGQVINSFGF
jgi:hypothetical protein